jgi:hypothetical protein
MSGADEKLPAVRQHDSETPNQTLGVSVSLPRRPDAAGYLVGQATESTPTAPEPVARVAGAPGGRSVPTVGGESSFGMNAQPERGSVVEYRQPETRLPERISAQEVYLDDTNPDGRVSGRVQR